MHVIYYISSHGYGHGVRSCCICNELPSFVKLTICSGLPIEFFREEIRRDFSYFPKTFDCGCIQPDSMVVDISATLSRYREIADQNQGLLDKEARWCVENGGSVIVSDIASFPFEVASRVSIPSVAISNFSWVDIYEQYCSGNDHFAPYLAKMRHQYASATLLCALDPANRMESFSRKINIPMVARKGNNRAGEIRKFYGISSSKKIGLVYTGSFGMGRVVWKRLGDFQEWEFIGIGSVNEPPANYRVVNKSDFSFQDCVASADLVISKIGYGICGECMACGIPLLYSPRPDFAEFPVLESAIKKWGGGYCVSGERFASLDIGTILDTVIHAPRTSKISCQGAKSCGRLILRAGGLS